MDSWNDKEYQELGFFKTYDEAEEALLKDKMVKEYGASWWVFNRETGKKHDSNSIPCSS